MHIIYFNHIHSPLLPLIPPESMPTSTLYFLLLFFITHSFQFVLPLYVYVQDHLLEHDGTEATTLENWLLPPLSDPHIFLLQGWNVLIQKTLQQQYMCIHVYVHIPKNPKLRMSYHVYLESFSKYQDSNSVLFHTVVWVFLSSWILGFCNRVSLPDFWKSYAGLRERVWNHG